MRDTQGDTQTHTHIVRDTHGDTHTHTQHTPTHTHHTHTHTHSERHSESLISTALTGSEKSLSGVCLETLTNILEVI